VLHAYVKSRLGRRRWFVHNRGEAGTLRHTEDLSFLQQQFLALGAQEYGQTKEDLPSAAKRHL